jgi:hypothetical protein
MQQPAEVTELQRFDASSAIQPLTALRRTRTPYLGGGFEGQPLEVVLCCPGCAAYEFSD